MKLGWYLRRLRRMSAAEVSARVQMTARQHYWANPARRPPGLATLLPGPRAAAVALRRADAPQGTPGAHAVIAAADRLLDGAWPVFHLDRAPIEPAPDWFRDPLTGRSAPAHDYAFAVPFRDEAKVGNIKFVWELSRHQATTLLACAWWLTGNDAYAERAAQHLVSWWESNPFLTGVHWTSGIEAGLRLLSWTWIRALLADWPGMPSLFDGNDVFAGQLYHHQLYVRSFHSRGSSANNHFNAELAGLASAATAFPWFQESADWASWSRAHLVEQAAAQTHPDGFNREQASDYHLFVFELLAGAALAARMAGQDLPPALDAILLAMADALAASLDASGQPPRFGDGDDGRGLLLDAPHSSHTAIILDVARARFGAAPWWPRPGGTVLGAVAAHLYPNPNERNPPRPSEFPDVGMTLLRAGDIWLRCDAGPHGFLSIAAHGHADALSIELRSGATEILADPGTYCYHGEPEWRALFKGTLGHNTLCLDGLDQADPAGPFLWLTRSHTELDRANVGASVQSWEAHHDGYARLPNPATHHRRVELDATERRVQVEDWVESAAAHQAALSFHLGPDITLQLDGAVARLSWETGEATMALPRALAWTAHRGEQDPPLGWYSPGFGEKLPANTLIGAGTLDPKQRLVTTIILS